MLLAAFALVTVVRGPAPQGVHVRAADEHGSAVWPRTMLLVPRVAQAAELTPWVFLPLLQTGRRGLEASPSASSVATGGATVTNGATVSATTDVTRQPSITATPSAEPTAGGTHTATPTIGPVDPADDRLVPGGALVGGETRVTYDADRQSYRLESRGDPRVVYEIDLTHPDVLRGRLAVRETTSGRFPLAGAGLYYRSTDGDLVEPRMLGRIGTVDSVAHAPIEDGVELVVHETIEDRAHVKRYRVRILGRALEVRAESLDAPGSATGAYAGFTAGGLEGTNDGVDVRVPYMEAVPVTMLDHRWFASTLLDVPQSHATSLVTRGPEAQPGAFVNEVAALYAPDEAGNVRPVDETIWLVLSPRIDDAFAIPSGRSSPHRSQLVSGVHLSLSSRTDRVTFGDESDLVARLKDLGASDLWVHELHWREPIDLLPGQGLPASAAGGVAGLALLSASAAGKLVPTQAYSVTMEGCPGESAPFYRPDDRALDAQGRPKRLLPDAGGERECGGGQTVGTFLLPPDAAARVALTDGEAFAVPGSGALHLLDVTAWNPAYAWPRAEDSVIDRASPARHPSTVGDAVLDYKRMFEGLQSAVGPVFGDGAHGPWHAAYDSFYAGYVDGVSRSLSTGSTGVSSGDAYLVVPDYELSVIRPLMVNYGMGKYEQFFGLPPADAVVPLTEQQIDAWRATTLSYGHAGAFTGTAATTEWLSEAEMVKEYYLMRALQARYLNASNVTVGYVDADGNEGDLSWALTEGLDLIGPRLHVAFGGGRTADGLEIWVNHGRDDWVVDPGDGFSLSYALPPEGWLALGVGLEAYSAYESYPDVRIDFLRTDAYTLLDGRGEIVRQAGIATTDLKIVLADGRVLEEQPDGSMHWGP